MSSRVERWHAARDRAAEQIRRGICPSEYLEATTIAMRCADRAGGEASMTARGAAALAAVALDLARTGDEYDARRYCDHADVAVALRDLSVAEAQADACLARYRRDRARAGEILGEDHRWRWSALLERVRELVAECVSEARDKEAPLRPETREALLAHAETGAGLAACLALEAAQPRYPPRDQRERKEDDHDPLPWWEESDWTGEDPPWEEADA